MIIITSNSSDKFLLEPPGNSGFGIDNQPSGPLSELVTWLTYFVNIRTINTGDFQCLLISERFFHSSSSLFTFVLLHLFLEL